MFKPMISKIVQFTFIFLKILMDSGVTLYDTVWKQDWVSCPSNPHSNIRISELGRESDGKVSAEEDRELTTFMKSEF